MSDVPKFFKTKVAGAKWLNDTTIPASAIMPEGEERELADYFTHAITTAFLLQRILNRLEGSAYDQREFRMKFKQFFPHLVKLAEREVSNLCDVNHWEAIWQIMTEQEVFMSQVARFRSYEYPMMAEVFRRLRENPDEVLEKLDIKINRVPQRKPAE